MCYISEKDIKYSKILTNNLEKEAKDKIKYCQEYLNSLNKNEEEEEEESESNSDDDFTSNNNEDSNSYYSSNIDKETSTRGGFNKINSSISKFGKTDFLKKATSLENSKNNTKIEKINPIRGSQSSKIIKEIKNDNENNKEKEKEKEKHKLSSSNSISKQMKKIQGKNNINNFYKVNLSQIHFMIYDFNKDMIVEGNKNEINIKVENIINNSKNIDII